MRRPAAGFPALIAALAVAGLATGALAPTARAGADGETPARGPAQVEKTFLIPTSDGYGVGECLTVAGSACGQVVADAWCEAQGYATAGSYGVAAADEYTGAVDLPAAKPADRPIRITCRD